MFCVKCGIELPNEANFCWKCGRQIRSVDDNPTLIEYEHCILKLRVTPWPERKIWEAWVGGTVIARGREWKEEQLNLRVLLGVARDDRPYEGDQAYLEFLSELTAQGWEPFPPNQSHIRTLRRAKRS